MRIVNAMFGAQLGGLEQVFLDYCDALTLAGHEVFALIHPRAAIRPALEARRTRFHAIGNFNAWDALAMLRLRSVLSRVRPDAVIAHGNRAVSLLRGAAAKPLIGVAPNYQLKCDGLAAVLCSTADLARHCRESGVDEALLWVVPNAVSVPPERPERPWRDPPVIGAMGRFVAKKGFAVLIEALARLAADGLAFRAVIAGAGAEADSLRALVRVRGLGQRVELPGWQDDKPRFFAAIDVFALPSHHEPFGVVLIEAMAQALPIVTTASEGPSQIVSDGHDGVIVPTDDPAALAAALAGLLRDPEAAAAMGARAYDTARSNYDLPLLAERLDRAVHGVTLRG
ncbi:MAG TPA: glycosyltransferase [Stellaceae bacterium]|nr:glycosyltransferase [Stellaceae bacterium]